QIGFQSAAAKVAGTLLVLVGVVRLARLHPRLNRPLLRSGSASGTFTVAAVLKRFKPLLDRQTVVSKAYLGGLITTWLPCGWLYLFVLVAAGTGGTWPAMLVMFAFWLGTLPALTAMLVGARRLTPQLRGALPVVASLFLIITGLYTAAGRAAVDVSSLVAPQLDTELTAMSLIHLPEQPLPCCSVHAATDDAGVSRPEPAACACCGDEEERSAEEQAERAAEGAETAEPSTEANSAADVTAVIQRDRR
ncbi:MAG: sulfite exporter TauE/SafE family protein, partial [Novipirellula sp. JB048]